MAKFVTALMKQLIKYSQARLSHWSFYWNSRLAQDRVDLWMALSRSKESSSPQHLPFRPHTHRNLGYLRNWSFTRICCDTSISAVQQKHKTLLLIYILITCRDAYYCQFAEINDDNKNSHYFKNISLIKRVSPMKPLNFKYLDNFHKKSKIWKTLLDH